MTADPQSSTFRSLGFSQDWFDSGILTPESAADFIRIAASTPGKSPRFWRWAVFRDFVEERDGLTAAECLAAYRLGKSEPDSQLGTAIICAVLYQLACPIEIVTEAESCTRSALRRTATQVMKIRPHPGEVRNREPRRK